MIMKETETTEFKKSTAELKSGVVSISAILNKHGKGELYFGIKDDGTVVGQTIGRNTIKDVTQTIVDNIEPKIYPEITVKKVKGKECVLVEFHGSHTPYFAYARAYMRVGESDKQMTAREIKRQFDRKQSFLWGWEEGDGLGKGGRESKGRGSEKSSEKSSEKILCLLRKNGNISAHELAGLIDISSRAVEKHLAKLKKLNKIKRVGPDKGGYWEVVE